MPSLENVDVLKTKDLGDVSLAQLLFDAVAASSTGSITVELDGEGTGFIFNIPHGEVSEDVH
jgi:hypothetical protein